MIPIQTQVGKIVGKFRREIIRFADERVKSIQEILIGIRVVKLYAYENPLKQSVSSIRYPHFFFKILVGQRN